MAARCRPAIARGSRLVLLHQSLIAAGAAIIGSMAQRAAPRSQPAASPGGAPAVGSMQSNKPPRPPRATAPAGTSRIKPSAAAATSPAPAALPAPAVNHATALPAAAGSKGSIEGPRGSEPMQPSAATSSRPQPAAARKTAADVSASSAPTVTTAPAASAMRSVWAPSGTSPAACRSRPMTASHSAAGSRPVAVSGQAAWPSAPSCSQPAISSAQASIRARPRRMARPQAASAAGQRSAWPVSRSKRSMSSAVSMSIR